MRGLLEVGYNIDLLEADNKAFTYNATLQGLGGKVLFDAKGAQRDKREDNTPEFNTKSSSIVLATFDIPAAARNIGCSQLRFGYSLIAISAAQVWKTDGTKEKLMSDEKPSYGLLTGEDSHEFCVRVSAALAEGYILYGSPAATYDAKAERMLVAQAVIRPEIPAVR